MDDTLRSRLFTTDTEAWNNAWYLYVGSPLLAALGATIGLFGGAHLVSTQLGEALVVGSCIGVTMFAGFAVLAAVDRRSAVES